MQLKLFHKLFLVLVGTSLCSVLLFAGFAHWYSSRSFLRYLNDARDARLAALSERLLAVYARDGDWRRQPACLASLAARRHAARFDRRRWTAAT